MTGKTLGHYRLESTAGQGGMGVVYRAVDTRLDRPAAIKILRADAVADADRKRRFMQEAKAASALNHPNIVTIYHIGTEGEIDFIAMELVAGSSLDAVIRNRPLPLPDAMRFAIQIADALSTAHDAGIVHRDLKPGNVMVTEKGQIKLLDFGLAKLTERTDSSDSLATATHGPETAAGMVVGTAAYMSPEQSQGLKVDARTDIFSFGVVLYEMIAGRRPQIGGNAGADLSMAPRDLRKIVVRCLQPDPTRRFQVMHDVRMALEDADVIPEVNAPSLPRSRRSLALWLGLAAIGVGALAAFAWWPRAPALSRGPMLTRLTMDSGLATDPVLSPDGRFVAFASDRSGEGNLDIWLRQVAGGDPVRLTTDSADDTQPAFSPDGTKIAFRSDRDGGGVYVMSTLGSGDARRIVDQGRRPRWSPDGNHIVSWTGLNTAFLISKADAPRVSLVAANGGEPRRLFDDFAVAFEPVWSADGAHLLFLGAREPRTTPEWWVAAVDGGPAVRTDAREMIQRSGLRPSPDSFFMPEVWNADGQVLFSAQLGDSTNIWQIRVPPTGAVTTPPQRLTSGTGLEIHPSAAAGGQLAYSVVTNDIDLWSLPTDTSTAKPTGPMRRLTQDPAIDVYPWFLPDSEKLAFISNRSGNYDVWIEDLTTGKDTVIAAQVSFPNMPIIFKNGSSIAFSRQGRWSALPLSGGAAVRSSTPQLICDDDCQPLWGISGDGKWLVYARESDSLILTRELATGRIVELLRVPGQVVGRIRISPDDRWIAFNHRAEGSARINVAPFRPGAPLSKEEWSPITTGEALVNIPTWSLDSGMLYFISEQDGKRCIWARRIDRQTGRPSGDAFPVWHFHKSRLSLSGMPIPFNGMTIARDRIVTSLSESTGNIWMATTVPATSPQPK